MAASAYRLDNLGLIVDLNGMQVEGATSSVLPMGPVAAKWRAFGWSVITYQSPDQLGLITLSGIVVEPRPFRAWRERPNAGGERRR